MNLILRQLVGVVGHGLGHHQVLLHPLPLLPSLPELLLPQLLHHSLVLGLLPRRHLQTCVDNSECNEAVLCRLPVSSCPDHFLVVYCTVYSLPLNFACSKSEEVFVFCVAKVLAKLSN